MKTFNEITIEEFMQLIINQVKENIKEIGYYNNDSENILQSMPVCKERTELLNSISSNIRNLTKKNIPLFNLYYNLLDFHKDHKNYIFEEKEISTISKSVQIFNFTNEHSNLELVSDSEMLTKSNLKLTSIHDVNLIEEQMNEFLKQEEYERCNAAIESFLNNKSVV